MLKDDDVPRWLAHLAGSPVAGFLMLALGILLVVLARRKLGNSRILLGTGAFLALTTALNSVVLYAMQHESQTHSSDYDRSSIVNHVALQSPQKIAGLLVPAGSVIQWSSEEHKSAKVQFAGPVNGADLTGTFDLGEFDWTGKLGTDHVLDGWPCQAGDIDISVDGKLDACTLAASRTLAGVTIPAGSSFYRSRNNEYEQPILDTKVSLKQKADASPIGIEFPVDSDVYFYDTGAIEKVQSGKWTVGVYGVDLGSVAYWHYPDTARGVAPAADAKPDFIEGSLYGDWQCQGRRLAQDTSVRLTRSGRSATVKPRIDPASAPAVVGCVAAK